MKTATTRTTRHRVARPPEPSSPPEETPIFNFDQQEDLLARYLMDELTDADRAFLDAQRRADPAFDAEVRRLERVGEHLQDAAGEYLCGITEVACQDVGATGPVTDDGVEVRVEPDQCFEPGPGVLARRLADELRAERWEQFWIVEGKVRGFKHPGTGRVVAFPFADNAWLGPRMERRLRDKLEDARRARP